MLTVLALAVAAAVDAASRVHPIDESLSRLSEQVAALSHDEHHHGDEVKARQAERYGHPVNGEGTRLYDHRGPDWREEWRAEEQERRRETHNSSLNGGEMRTRRWKHSHVGQKSAAEHRTDRAGQRSPYGSLV